MTGNPHIGKSIWNNEDGAILVETAVFLPFFFVLMLGVFEFAYYFYNRQILEQSVRDATRYLARTDNPQSALYQTNATNLVIYGAITNTGTPLLRNLNTSDATVTISFGTVDNAFVSGGERPFREAKVVCYGYAQISFINIKVSFKYTSLALFPALGLAPPPLNVSETERCIGPG